MNRVIAWVAAAFASAGLVASGAPAHAEKAVVDDPFRDVWRVSYAEDASWQEIGTKRNVDIDRSVIRHGGQNVVATTTFKSLRKQGDRYVAGWVVRTDEGREFLVAVQAEGGAWAGALVVVETNPPPVDGESESQPAVIECDAVHEIDYSADTLAIRVPRSCLGDPEWIRGMSLAESHTSDGSSSFRDHGHHRGHALRRRSERLSAG